MQPARRKNRLLKPLGYVVLGLVVFVLSLWWMFPYDDVAHGIETRLAAAGIEARLTRLHPVTPLTFGVDEIQITRWQDRPMKLTLGPTTASLQLGPLLDGKIGVEVESRSFGGELLAKTVYPNPETVDASWSGVDFALLLPALVEEAPQAKGTLSGSATLAFPPVLARLRATLDAEVKELTVGPGTVMGFPLPPIALGSGPLRIEAQNGRARIFDTRLSGGDLSLSLDGNIQLAAPLGRSTLDLSATLKPSGKAEGAVGMLFGMLAPNKAADGTYPVKLKGLLSAPSVTSR